MVDWVVCAGGLGFFLDAPKGRSPGRMPYQRTHTWNPKANHFLVVVSLG